VTDQTDQILPASRQPVNPAVPDGVVRPRPAGPRTPEAIERDIDAARARLASTIDELGEMVKPANVAKRIRETARLVIFTPDGALRTKRIAIAAGVVASLLVLRKLLHK
jgi:hypothetical protein